MTDESINAAIRECTGISGNFVADLNAMHEAEGTLDQEQLGLYVDSIISTIHEVDSGYFHKIHWGHAVELTTATARQRSEAFLKTKGLWKP